MCHEVAREVLEQLAGHSICEPCAESFVAILDAVRDQRAEPNVVVAVPAPRVPVTLSCTAPSCTTAVPLGGAAEAVGQ